MKLAYSSNAVRPRTRQGSIDHANRHLVLTLSSGKDRYCVDRIGSAQSDVGEAEKLIGDSEEVLGKPTATGAVPSEIRQYTFQEAKTLGQALATAQSFRGWDVLEGQVALRYGLEGKPHEVRLTPSSRMAECIDGPPTDDKLKAELSRVDFHTVLLLHTVLGIAIKYGELTMCLDDLIRMIGQNPRSRADRVGQRLQVWKWLLLIESCEILGERAGYYRDRATRTAKDLLISGPLIQIAPARTPLDDCRTVPEKVLISASDWLAAARGDNGVLPHFGDLKRIALLPSGKPSGAWAQSIALALHQRWRERAAHVGKPQRFTRRDLLELFPARPEVNDVLHSANPSRAMEYWNQAIRMLRGDQGGVGLIDTCRVVRDLVPERQGWQSDWLQQPLEIEPAEQFRETLAEIRAGAERHGNRHGGKPLRARSHS